MKEYKILKVAMIAVVMMGITFIGCEGIPESKTIYKTDYEKGKWPFSYDEAILKCYKDDVGEAPLVVINGKSYGLTGYADNMYGAKDINAINEVWLKDESSGLMIDLGPITDEAKTLCRK